MRAFAHAKDRRGLIGGRGTHGALAGARLGSAIAIAVEIAAASCDERAGITCRIDSQCGPAGVCIEGLCFLSELADAGRDSPSASTRCDAGETGACTASVGEICLHGNRACDGGTWDRCMPVSASTDVERCGSSCGPCGLQGDRCEQGICRCANSPRCDAGQRCAGAECVCDSTSCPGCCTGSCYAVSFPRCRSQTASCATCDAMRADQCSTSGGCQCGPGPQCAAGQRCNGGVCVCDAQSCPLGCCDPTACRLSSMASCGVAGRSCAICDPVLADRCLSSGICACGSSVPCIPGQRCLEGVCICEPCLGVASPPSDRGLLRR
jgi:hypothetical protein